jgi:hypothetical protein
MVSVPSLAYVPVVRRCRPGETSGRQISMFHCPCGEERLTSAIPAALPNPQLCRFRNRADIRLTAAGARLRASNRGR